MRQLQLLVCAIMLSGAALAFGATDALATSDHYFSGGLSPGRSFASSSLHSGVYFSQAVAVHNHCAGAVSSFYRTSGGYSYDDPNDDFAEYQCGKGTVAKYLYNLDGNWRGLVFNPNGVTIVSVTDAHYSW